MANEILIKEGTQIRFFITGSLALLTIDATDPTAPTITAKQIISTSNFAGVLSTHLTIASQSPCSSRFGMQNTYTC